MFFPDWPATPAWKSDLASAAARVTAWAMLESVRPSVFRSKAAADTLRVLRLRGWLRLHQMESLAPCRAKSRSASALGRASMCWGFDSDTLRNQPEHQYAPLALRYFEISTLVWL